MITIREYKTEDLESVMDIWNVVVREGIAFPQDEELTKLNIMRILYLITSIEANSILSDKKKK